MAETKNDIKTKSIISRSSGITFSDAFRISLHPSGEMLLIEFLSTHPDGFVENHQTLVKKDFAKNLAEHLIQMSNKPTRGKA